MFCVVGFHGLACAEEQISGGLMLCKLLTITNVYGEISRPMAQYGNKDDTGEYLTKVEMLSAQALQTVRNVYSLLGSGKEVILWPHCVTLMGDSSFQGSSYCCSEQGQIQWHL